jgi:hypothetical protein
MRDETAFALHFTSLLEYRQALDAVVAQARHTLRLFDCDMHDGGWNSPQRYEGLKFFLLASPQNRLHIALHNVDYISRNCPRMMRLLREHSYAVFIHQTNPEAQAVFDSMLIGDDAHFVHRFHYEHPRGEYVLNSPDETHGLLQRFTEIWHASTLAVPATTLGL